MKKTAAMVLSWKRPDNIPIVIDGLKRQGWIDDIIIWHNSPSNVRIDGCINIVSDINFGCMIRHHMAAMFSEYDYFAFSDDDLVLTMDLSEYVNPAIDEHGKHSVLGFFGHLLNANNPKRSYSTGKTIHSSNGRVKKMFPVNVVKGRFHIVSKEQIHAALGWKMDCFALCSEDDIRINASSQEYFFSNSFLIPAPKGFYTDLEANDARMDRENHWKLRDDAAYEGLMRND
jgi:hypothetical protein